MPESRPRPVGMLVLSYLTFFGFIPLLAAKGNREVRWHAANGLLLFGAVVAVGIVATVIGILVPALSCIYPVLMFVVLIVYTIIAILAIVKALDGQRLIVPAISRYADRF
ncbi:MAG TPA: hypothetical protein VGQ32_11355 [Thermoanaerobaculia bacterium]|jgi:uncharacterized membrane protein|nr:hypothetical protein [Thermoanaerobaculia bacterium]